MNQLLILLSCLIFSQKYVLAGEFPFRLTSSSWFHPDRQVLLSSEPRFSSGFRMTSVPALNGAGIVSAFQVFRLPDRNTRLLMDEGIMKLGVFRKYSASMAVYHQFGPAVTSSMEWRYALQGLPVYGYQSNCQVAFTGIWRHASWLLSSGFKLRSESKWKRIDPEFHVLYRYSADFSMEVVYLHHPEGPPSTAINFQYKSGIHQCVLSFRDGPGLAFYWQSSKGNLSWQLGFAYHPVFHLYPSFTGIYVK